MIKNVCIAGGTHGDELTGVYLVKYWNQNPHKVKRNSFQTSLLLSNPPAVKKCVRYIDCDLNRQFTKENIQETERKNPEELPWEVQRACQISKEFSGTDFVIDIHNTTSNSSMLFIKEGDYLTMHIVDQMRSVLKTHIRVYTFKPSDFYDVCCIGKHSIGIESGPQPRGILKSSHFTRVEAFIYTILDLLEKLNNGEISFTEHTMEVFKFNGTVDFPRDEEGDLAAMVHPDLDGRDWEPLHPGQPMFMTFSGETIPYENQETVWPVFINEAAYMEKKIAFMTTVKDVIKLPAL